MGSEKGSDSAYAMGLAKALMMGERWDAVKELVSGQQSEGATEVGSVASMAAS